MKHMLSFFIAAVVTVVFAVPSFAYPRPVEKLKDGVVAVIKSPLQIKEHAMAEAKDGSFLLFSLPAGLLKGSCYMVRDMVGGVLDIVTFPIDK
ncbi:MAG: hypothetical protein Q7K71_05770 [Candidatus Omnitrophota bacterium]|nr:hypothetical protein [Candidatus Omnitrophota bacterium]